MISKRLHPASFSNVNTQLAQNAAVNKNKIINGQFDVWQRGSSFNATGYTADRFKLTLGSGASATVSQQAFTVGQTDVPNNPTNYVQIALTAGSADSKFEQRIEDVAKLSGNQVTLSFWAKVSSGTYALSQLFKQYFDGSADADSDSQSFTLTTTWLKFTRTITLGSVSGKTIGADNYLAVLFVMPYANGNATISMANVCVVHGATASECESEPIDEVLRKCQRYFESIKPTSMKIVDMYQDTSLRVSAIPFKSRKRKNPTLYTNASGITDTYSPAGAEIAVWTHGAASKVYGAGTWSGGGTLDEGGMTCNAATSFTNANSGSFVMGYGPSVYLYFDAEL